MSSPQLEDGYMRIANEFWDEVMMRDFSKRQRNILDLILRLSWGCGKKTAIIPKLRYFQLVGVRPNHVRAELEWLVKANVIEWDKASMAFAINKHYSQWSVSLSKGYDEDELNALIHLNLTSQNGNESSQKGKFDPEKTDDEVPEKGSKLPETGSLELPETGTKLPKKGSLASEVLVEVPEKGSPDFPKREVPHDVNPHVEPVSGVPKDSIKDNKYINQYINHRPTVRGDPDTGYLDPIISAWHHHIGMLGSKTQMDKLYEFVKDGMEPGAVVQAITVYAKKLQEDSRTSFSYLEAVLKNWYNTGVRTEQDAVERLRPRREAADRERGSEPRVHQGDARSGGAKASYEDDPYLARWVGRTVQSGH